MNIAFGLSLFLLNIVILRLLTFMVGKLGIQIHDDKTSPSQRLFLKLLVWLLAGFGAVIVIGTVIVVYRTIVG